MTREEVLVEMEVSFAEMPEELRTTVLFADGGTNWTPTLLLEEVRKDTEIGKRYVQSWADHKEGDENLLALLDALLGQPGPDDMTCGLPDCQHCHGEVRPFNQKE